MEVRELDGFHVGIVRFDGPMEALSCAVLNGGDAVVSALMVMQVPRDYRHDDPEADAARVRDALGLPADTLGMMTAAEVATVFNLADGECGGMRVSAVATAGLSNHVVAGEILENYPERRAVSDSRSERLAGTINIAVISPVPLTMEGKVNIMIPLVEAKSAAMGDLGYRETGTTSDAMAVLCPIEGERVGYAGTGSDIGVAAARAVRSAVGAALRARGEHPVLEEPLRILRGLGYGMDDLARLSGSGMSPEEFRPLMERALGDRRLRSLLDLALFCAARADSMAEDGSTGDAELMMRMIVDVTGEEPDPGRGVAEAALASIARYAVRR